MILFFDTETTGLYQFKEEPTSPSQPYLVQLACIGTDEVGNEVLKLNALVKPTPENRIPDNMIHGISHDEAAEYGINGMLVAMLFANLIGGASRLVCHNYGFDSKIMSTHLLRHDIAAFELHKDKDFCTMLASTNYCKLPNPKFHGKWKWPKLREAYEFLFPDKPVNWEEAHDALFDVRRTKEVYFELLRREQSTVTT